jgi:hypothetical protein
MTAPHQSFATNSKGLGSSGASVERPISRNSSNYTLRFCVTPIHPETPSILVQEDGAINNLHTSHRMKTYGNLIPATSVFDVMEFVRPFKGSLSDPSHRTSATSESWLKQKASRHSTLPVHQLSTEPNLHPPTLHCKTSPSQNRKGRLKDHALLSSKIARELFQEPGAHISRIVEQDQTFVDSAVTKPLLNRKANNDHNGSGFKLAKNDDNRDGIGTTGNFPTKARTRPWHQMSEPIPMKYFMNGVGLAGNILDVTAPDVIEPALTATLRPSLFSLRCHRNGMHKSLKSLLQPERVRMSRQAALDFIQGQVDVWYAACQGDTDLLAAYIDAGVIVDALDRRYGRTPLQYAAGNNNTAIMRLLLQAGASVHSEGSRDKDSNTPLHFAALYGKTEAANYLLDNDADGMGLNANGLSPLRLALDSGHSATAELLKKYGATLQR